jgi:hypothetical protein
MKYIRPLELTKINKLVYAQTELKRIINTINIIMINI